MSFVIVDDQQENKFDLCQTRVSNGPDIISPTLRGNAWPDVIAPPYYNRIPFSIISLDYGRPEDLVRRYQDRRTRVRDVRAVRGAVLHASILRCLEYTRRYLMRCRTPGRIDIIKKLKEIRAAAWKAAMGEIPSRSSAITPRNKKNIKFLASRVLDFECNLLASRIGFLISRDSGITRDTLVESVPFQVEPHLNLPDMGFSGTLTPDLVWSAKRAVGEIKTGRESKSHVIELAGYALALEKRWRTTIDIGFILYLDTQKSYRVPAYMCAVYPLSDVYRRLFIQKRNEALKIVTSHFTKRQH